MINRFKGKGGRQKLIDALLKQASVQGNKTVAEKVAKAAKLLVFQPNERLIEQDGDDTDLFFILDGRVAVHVNGRQVSERVGGQHVGEMALISPTGRRSATVIASAETTVARVKSTKFIAIADAHPLIWRLLASELVDRFRQRGHSLREPNPEPRVFIGSSVEGLDIAKAIQAGLAHMSAHVEIWTNNVFTASAGTMEALEKQAASSDLAVLIATADDKGSIRGKKTRVARDNVVFELGLFMGTLSRQRTIFLIPRGVDLHIPSDLHGITPLTYQHTTVVADLPAKVGPACTEIEKLIKALGAR